MRIVYILTGLELGGAETMFYKMISNSQKLRENAIIVTMMGKGYYGELLESLGLPIRTFNMNPSSSWSHAILTLQQLCTILQKGDIVVGWTYHACLMTYLPAKIKHASRLVWFIRNASLDPKHTKFRTILIARICSWLSRWVDLVTYNGVQCFNSHRKLGTSNKNAQILHNFVDIKLFSQKSIVEKTMLRKELGIPIDAWVVVSATRWHPIKDIPTLIKAFSIVAKQHCQATLVLCGTGLNNSNEDLMDCIRKNHVEKRVLLFDKQQAIYRFLQAADLFVLSSEGETFPNVLVESMACGRICVSTDVGDASEIVGDNGFIVAPGNPTEMAMAMDKVFNLKDDERMSMERRARESIIKRFDIANVHPQYENAILQG